MIVEAKLMANSEKHVVKYSKIANDVCVRKYTLLNFRTYVVTVNKIVTLRSLYDCRDDQNSKIAYTVLS